MTEEPRCGIAWVPTDRSNVPDDPCRCWLRPEHDGDHECACERTLIPTKVEP